jgi:hypothetical protein
LRRSRHPASGDAAAETCRDNHPTDNRAVPTDVATAVKTLVSQGGNVTTTNMSAKQDAPVVPVSDQPQPKSEPVADLPRPMEAAPSVTELSFTGQGEFNVGEKRQMGLLVKSDAPLGLAVITLRFDPTVLRINGVSAGSLFTDAKTAPTLTQSIDEHGMALLSLTPAAGSKLIADGVLLNLEVEAVSAGDAALAFDLSNVHLVASDGRALLLQIVPAKLTVK